MPSGRSAKVSAKRWKDYNIHTTILSPGGVKTELLDQISDEAMKSAKSDYVNQVGIFL